ncbi:BTAD domain-containing putative transcriptional regulator [Bacillus sp. T33-2]|uniref:BTAD domain-containing putative transcriptional regulator n=1 Tax=Bacillus sp. T33-2 TaxID=2054168 RepID=UPI000C792DE3|nr:BTAD domain-containing putative transcriptional regulator [Bacillus sp. T33-2]PLR97692.1 transcriptional regulator [Bacillus sp. T33-2]
MDGTLPLMKTKLIVPNVKEQWIRRAKLSRKMKNIAWHPLTLVQAGAGYGKSTALALFVKDEQCPCCWYTISASDDDILPFLAHLTAAIKQIHSGFGKDVSRFMTGMDRYIREEELENLRSLFINEIMEIGEPVTVVLDDFHAVEHSYNINIWMEKLLEHIPENLHLVISTRSRPGWKILTKMKVSGLLNELTKEDLVFNKEEIELLISDNYDAEITEEELNILLGITEGWVIAIGMIAQQLPHKAGLMDLFQQPSGSLEDLFQYLVLEVFSKQPPMIQQFLEQTCILEEINDEACDKILGISGSGTMLKHLTDKNLFIHQVGGNQYRYHALFKELLENRMKAGQPENYRLLRERSARYYESTERWDEALACYEKINRFDAVASIMHDQGATLLENGKLESLYDRLSKIPVGEKNAFYTLWFLEGEVLRYRSLYKEAEACYDRALSAAGAKDDMEWKSRALEGKARIYLDTIQPLKAERFLSKAIELREKRMPGQMGGQTGELYRLLAENLINSGQALKAEKWISRARAMQVPIQDGNLEARLYLRTGRFDQARRFLKAKDDELADMRKHTLPQSHRETDLLLALIEAFTGNGLQSKILAQDAIQYGIRVQAPFVEACGWIRMGHAVLLNDEYDAGLAEQCYETALEIMERIRVERGKAEPLMGLCLLYAVRGDYERAIEAGELGLKETERVKDTWLSSLITLCVGIASLYNGRLAEAENHFLRAEDLFAQCGDEFGRMLSAFWLSYFNYLADNEGEFKLRFGSFLERMESGRYEFFLKKRTTFGPSDLQVFAPLLIKAQKLSVSPACVAKLLQDLKLSRLSSHPGYTLKIQTLGQFRVWIGNKEVEDRDWQRGKAKELFQLFVTNRRNMLLKEDIYEMLWAGHDENHAARDFKVALNALNNVLEPNRKARANSFFIIRDGPAYGLNPNAAIEIDASWFEEWAVSGLEENQREQAARLLGKSLHLYKGDYLPDRKYEDWCINERERLLVCFLRSAEKLAQLNVRTENYDSAIHWCLQILQKDRTWEEAYRLLIFCYYRKNNRPQAIKWYKKCCKTLEDELGVSPLEQTRHMYRMVIESSLVSEKIQQL